MISVLTILNKKYVNLNLYDNFIGDTFLPMLTLKLKSFFKFNH